MRLHDATENHGNVGQRRPRVPLVLPGLAVIWAAAALVLTAATGAARIPDDLPLPTPIPSVPVHLPTAPAVNPPSLPTALPSLPVSTPTPVATPSLPVSLGTPTPTATTNPTDSPTAAATPAGDVARPGSGSTAQSGSAGGGAGGSGGGIHLPLIPVVINSPLDAALLGAFAVLPLLLGIWMLVFGRAWQEARRSRDAQVRLAIASDLGMSPRELISVTTKGLFKLREQAAFDELTGVMRRAGGIHALDREIARARRQKSPLAVAFIDVDGLKQANDARGHKAGDELLRGLAGILKSGFRGQDLVIRYGGDEFVCILPDTVADAARAKLSWIQTEAEKAGVNFSVGVTQLERSDDVVSLLGRADQEMYAIKARRGKIRDLRLGVVGGTKKVPA